MIPVIPLHKIENDFICMSQCYKENRESTNIVHFENYQYYEQDCTSSMEKPFTQKFTVIENKSQ